MVSPSWAVNYYVSTTGNDANDGSTDAPWRNPQKCVQSGTPLVAGDSCIIRAGTYTNETGSIPGGWKGRIMVVTSTSPVATSAARITIKAENPGSVTFEIPNAWPGVDCNVSSCVFAGIYFSGNGSYYTVEGLGFTRPGSAYGTNASIAGVSSLSATTGLIIRNNYFHDIARTVCSDGTFGNGAMFIQTPTGAVVEKNLIHTIGRLRNGESGCSTVIFHHDHGIYIEASTDLTIRNNVCYDTTRGFCINLKARVAGTKTLRAKIYHNTFSGDSPTTQPNGQIALTNQLDDVQIKNNIFNAPEGGYFVWTVLPGVSFSTVPVGAGIIIQNNLSDSTRTNGTVVQDQASFSLITSSGNLLSTATGLTNVGANDYTLTSTSAAINAGADLSFAKCGAGEDIGAFEVCAPVSGAINTNVAEVTIETTFPPVQTFGTTGWTVNCTGTGCGTPVVSGVSLKSASSGVVQLTISGITGTNCAAGQTWTASFNQSTGDLSDSVNIGSSVNQNVHTFSTFALTNNCSGSATSYPGSPVLVYLLNENTGTNANDETANNRDGTLTNGPTWAPGKDGSGVSLLDLDDDYIATPYGSGINPSTTSYTFAFWVDVPVGNESAQRTYAGFSLGTNQRLHIGTNGGSWGLGIQTSSLSTTSNLTVSSGWHHVCLRMDSTTDTATLYIDAIAGNAGTSAQKTYTSFTTASTFNFGRPIGFTSAAPGGVYDDGVIYDSLVDCTTLYEVREPTSTPSGGTLTQVAHQWEISAAYSGSVQEYGLPSATVEVPKGALISLTIQIDRTTAAGSSFAPSLWFTHNGGTEQPLTDLVGTDQVSFANSSVRTSTFQGAVTCCLTGALTPNDGTTQITSSALPIYPSGVNYSFVRRSVIKFTDSASGTYCFFERDQTGVALNGGYTPSSGACVRITEKAAGGQ